MELLIGIAILIMIDFIETFIAIFYIGGFREINPIMAPFMDNPIYFTLIYSLFVSLFMFMLYIYNNTDPICSETRQKAVLGITLFVFAVKIFVVINNLKEMIG